MSVALQQYPSSTASPLEAAYIYYGITGEHIDIDHIARCDPATPGVDTFAEHYLPTADPDPEQEAIGCEARDVVHQALGRLSERDRDIIKKRFGIGAEEHTLAEISEQYGLSKERVRQIEA